MFSKYFAENNSGYAFIFRKQLELPHTMRWLIHVYYTPAEAKMICDKNVRAWVIIPGR